PAASHLESAVQCDQVHAQGGKVQLRLEGIDSHLEISVADNGPGIDQRALENVFGRFWQGPVRNITDSGMGLAARGESL
ncbi:MAG: ATP-binding protein, partial [Acidobacteriota bacterium]|nr:ATP-binding protein [Acidobacteriota bacterium]